MTYNIGDKLWLVKTPFLMIHYQKELEGGPQLYEIIETYYIDDINNPSYKLKNLKTGWILFYGNMSGPEWQKYQGDLFDEIKN
jgi:hypothetical protein